MAKILISADMEGVAGITHRKQILRDNAEFARSCRLMTAEVAAACEGALEAGATSVVVNDSHSDMRNLVAEDLPPQVELLSGNVKLWSMVHGIDGSFDGIAFLGYHAPAASIAGILDHTYHGSVVQEVRLNGEPMSEARLNALVAGTFGVPAIFFSGDQNACADATRFLPWIVTVTVKHAFGRTAAQSLSPQFARAAIRDGMARAVRSIAEAPGTTYAIAGPLTLDVNVMNAEMADQCELLPDSVDLARPGCRL
jgi:D-amino peptidase